MKRAIWSLIVVLTMALCQCSQNSPVVPESPLAKLEKMRFCDWADAESSANIRFSMRGFDGVEVEMTIIPKYRKEFIKKLKRLSKDAEQLDIALERAAERRARLRKAGFATEILEPGPMYAYEYFVKDGKKYDYFRVIARTYIFRNNFDYCMNAKKYFTKKSWAEVDAKLHSESDDREDSYLEKGEVVDHYRH